MPYPSRPLAFIFTLSASLAVPALAAAPQGQPKTAGDEAKSVVTAPLEDTNIQKKKIPPVLEKIGDNPYARANTQSCQAIASAVAELDGVLGPDFDEPPPPGQSADAKAVSTAGQVALGFIPGRGLIREVSGANKAEQRYNQAISAGLARRGFLKGVGVQRGCKAPAAPRN